MRVDRKINHEFVDFIPRELEDDTLYISIEYGAASHRCFCGCGAEVVTPISPVGWQLTYDGEVVWLSPSVGSWNLTCRSHYWIKADRVVWAGEMSDREIAAVQLRDRIDITKHYEPAAMAKSVELEQNRLDDEVKHQITAPVKPDGFLQQVSAFFSRWF